MYQGDNVSLEIADPDGLADPTESAELSRRYLFGPAVDQILAVEDDQGDVFWGLADHEGTVRDVLDVDGDLAQHLDFDAFGSPESASTTALPTTYAGRPRDPATGLYDYRARWYDAEVGRFVNEDPSSFAAGDPNLYRYCGNSPLTFVDPSGLCYTGLFGGFTSGVPNVFESIPDSLGSIGSAAVSVLSDMWGAATNWLGSLGTSLSSQYSVGSGGALSSLGSAFMSTTSGLINDAASVAKGAQTAYSVFGLNTPQFGVLANEMVKLGVFNGGTDVGLLTGIRDKWVNATPGERALWTSPPRTTPESNALSLGRCSKWVGVRDLASSRPF
ncbi:MAG: hypothetical protein JW818_15665 [Pirellulales bacterium]|nr:hypothetical protein [Pirellulales bacterium]